MKRIARRAAAAALAAAALTACGNQSLAADPYWATCEQLADQGVRAEVAKALTKKAGLPTLTTGGVAQRIETVCAAELGDYRPGLDAVRRSQSASLQ